MEDKTLTAQESLDLIGKMIQTTRQKYERGAGQIFLLWGYLVVLTTVAVHFLHRYDPFSLGYNVYYLFLAIPIVGYSVMFITLRHRPKPANTYIDKVISSVWVAVGLAAILPTITIMFDHTVNIMFIMGVIIPIGVMITALVLQYRSMFVLALCGAVLNYAVFIAGLSDYTLLNFASIFVVSMIIPGHLLNYKGARHNG